MFTLDTESGFDDVVLITASYGLGELLVQGAVNPDEFYVYKPNLTAGRPAILQAYAGQQAAKDGQCRLRRAERPREPSQLPNPTSFAFAWMTTQVETLARQALAIEEHYGMPMDIEWAKDGVDGALYMLQARPETVRSRLDTQTLERFVLRAAWSRAGHGTQHRSTHRCRTGVRARPRERDVQGQSRRCYRHRHDRPGLGARDETRRRGGHQPWWAHLPRGDHRA